MTTDDKRTRGRPARTTRYVRLTVQLPADMLEQVRAGLRNPLTETVPVGALQAFLIEAIRTKLEQRGL